MLIAHERAAQSMKRTARDFIEAMCGRDFDSVWRDCITIESAEFLAATAYPFLLFKEGKIDELFVPDAGNSAQFSKRESLALAFQVDALGERSGLFEGVASVMESVGWCDFSETEGDCWVFTHERAAVLVAKTIDMPLIIFFVRESDGIYRIDFLAWVIFSMAYRPSDFHEIAVRALELGDTSSAVTFFQIVASLEETFERLRYLCWAHPAVRLLITDERRQELQLEERYILLSKERLEDLLSGPKVKSIPLNLGQFLSATFKGYGELEVSKVTTQDEAKLHSLRDSELRKAIAGLLTNVDRVEAMREAEKPHTPSEIADMELPLIVDGVLYHLCMPFKSGQEISRSKLDEKYAYQLTRPFLSFQHCIVVLITAKPCSQPLLNEMKKMRDRFGWPIAVIQHKELAALLKMNNIL